MMSTATREKCAWKFSSPFHFSLCLIFFSSLRANASKLFLLGFGLLCNWSAAAKQHKNENINIFMLLIGKAEFTFSDTRLAVWEASRGGKSWKTMNRLFALFVGSILSHFAKQLRIINGEISCEKQSSTLEGYSRDPWSIKYLKPP